MEALQFGVAGIAVALMVISMMMIVAVILGLRNAYDAQLRSRFERVILMLAFIALASINGVYLVWYASGDL